MTRAAAPSTRLEHCAAAAAARPDDADAQMFLGNALLEAGRTAEAVAAYDTAMALRHGHAPTLYNLGNAQLAAGDAAAAEASFRAALALAPDHAGTHNNRGNALRQLGRVTEAAASYRAALALRPEAAGIHNNLGSALVALHQPEQAEGSLLAALCLDPNYAEACNNLGGALLAQDRPEAALDWFARAVKLDPAQAQARFGTAMALLSLGRLREGFAAYEARWLDPRFREDARSYDAPLWLGETPLAGRTILLHAEQGLGDTIQFVRYAPLLRARGAAVVMEVQAPLVRLLRPLADGIVAAGDPLPAHDVRTPLLSLAHAFATELATVPAAVPYLHPPSPDPAARVPGLNLALTLSGSADHPEDALRSIPARLLLPLLHIPGVHVHVVQNDLCADDEALLRSTTGLRLHGPALGDFAETAALLAAMDLVISVDTAVAHLAGALGLPVWVMLQHAADFRWLRGRENSPWYPTATLFRQGAERRWEPVIAHVGARLAALAAN